MSFIYLYRYNSFKEAAGALYLTQPSLTSRIKNLEKELGDVLFIRRKNGVELTERGKVFLPYAFRILDTYTQAQEALKKDSDALCIGSIISASSVLLHDMIELLKRSSHLYLRVKTGATIYLTEHLLNGEIDFAISQHINHPDITQVLLFEDPITLFASPEHYFSTRGTAVTLEELALEPLIVYDAGSAFWNEIEQRFAARHLRPYRLVEVDSLEASKNMILRGNGIAFLPELSLDEDIQNGKICRIPLYPHMPISRNIYISHRRDIAPSRMEYISLLATYFAKNRPEEEPSRLR